MDKRFFKLFKLLSNSKTLIKSKELCDELDISPRTLRNDLKKYKSTFLENGVNLVSKPGVGYYFEIFDENLYYKFIQIGIKNAADNQILVPVYPEERINYIIKLLLSLDNYIKIEELEEKLFVSRSTLTTDLKEVRERLQYYHLEIENKPNYGMKIIGEEFDRRACMSKYFFYVDFDEVILNKEKNENKDIIKKILYNTINEYNFMLTDIGFKNLVIHIMILLMRVKVAAESGEIESIYKNLEKEKEFEIATILVSRLENQFKIKFPKKELYYITIHLLGKKSIHQDVETLIIDEEVQELLDYIFKHIKLHFHIDFSKDFELFRLLALHFQPMMNRLKYGLYIENPLINQIRDENQLAFEIAIYVGSVIKEIKNYDVDINEIGYMALHFALAIERRNEKIISKNIIVVCASGAGSSQILLYKLKQKFKNYINDIRIAKVYELDDMDQSKFDYIISTVPITFKTKIPIINVQYFLTDEDENIVSKALLEQGDYSFIENYFKDELFFEDVEGNNKEEIIKYMTNKISTVIKVPNNFYEQIMQRERIASTEYGNNIALPHPIKPTTETTFVAVGVLKKVIRWDKHNVRLVFLISTKKNSDESLSLFNESMATLVFNRKALVKLEKSPNIFTLKEIIREIAINERNNTIDNLFN